jgi:ribonuclease PH
MDGKIKKEDIIKAIALGQEACKKIYEVQKQALKKRYEVSK